MATTLARNVRKSAFERDGYLVLESALGAPELEELKEEAARICRGELGEIPGVEPAPGDEPEDSVLSRYLCIHHPHKISDVAASYIGHPAIVEVLVDLIGPNVKCMQSMLFIKSAGKPGQAWHQDEDYIPTRDRSLTAAWIALDDATIENGCLWVIPGSQRHGILWAMKENDDPEFDCNDESYGFPYADDDGVPVEVAAGSVVFFNGYLLHRSLRNRAAGGYRRSLVHHYMSAESLLPWRRPPEDVFVAQHDYRDVVLVAGKDPYGYKGYESFAKTHVRAENLGGCRPEDAVKRYE
jgi:ectoine hydroxylase-related dioxygenase (phytanoyl-CoA dioxygenase family)